MCWGGGKGANSALLVGEDASSYAATVVASEADEHDTDPARQQLGQALASASKSSNFHVDGFTISFKNGGCTDRLDLLHSRIDHI